MSLNPAQREAVEHFQGPLIVLAGPGSGKTRVVTQRIARLLERGVPAEAILAVTFTNKAAREMRERVRTLVGQRAKGLTTSTIHSACLRILRSEIEVLGYGRNFSIYDEGSQASLARTILRDLSGAGATKSAQAVLDGVGQLKLGRPAGAEAAAGVESQAKTAFVTMAVDRYREEMFARNAVDFDDIILLTARLLREHPDVLERWREQWQFLLVDEYQDTNAPQEEVISLLAGERRNLCVVGDDDQSIYGWRGAEVENILQFERRHRGARTVRLECNYRSTGRIVDASNAIAARLARRCEKTLFTEAGDGERIRLLELPDQEEEADYIAGAIASAVHAPGGDPWREAARLAVLLRTNEAVRPLEQALREMKVPYRLLGGRSFFDRKEILDLAAYLRLSVNRRDEEALFRIVNTPARGLGAKTLQALRDEARARKMPAWDVFGGAARGELLPADLPARATAPLRSLVDAVETLAAQGEARSLSLITDLARAIRYEEEIERTYQDTRVREARKAFIPELQQAWERHLRESSRPALRDFVDEIALQDRKDDREAGPGVTLATVHAAKGLEWDHVFIAGVEEGSFPHGRSLDDGPGLDEERRVFYVAVTRARHRLVLTWSAERETRGKRVKRVPSRFLEDLPESAVSRGDADAPATDDSVAASLERMRAALRGGQG